MKKEWQKPELAVLNISMTMAGPGIRYNDATYTDFDEEVHLNHS
ncbi:MAG: paeninodin family lasso peptide [Carboxydocellales bacterium]